MQICQGLKCTLIMLITFTSSKWLSILVCADRCVIDRVGPPPFHHGSSFTFGLDAAIAGGLVLQPSEQLKFMTSISCSRQSPALHDSNDAAIGGGLA
jgi:hypothetical protein